MRFNVPYWQKFERMPRFARDRDVIVSVIQEICGCDRKAGEKRLEHS